METSKAVQDAFDYDSEVVVWDQGTFEPSDYPLESLERELDRADFGIFLFFPDDVTIMRGKQQSTVRDNVLFELGLFVGRLGRKRTFILTPRGADLHLPSDLSGITPVEYEADRTDQNMLAAVGPAARRIRQVIQTTGLRPKPANTIVSPATEGTPAEPPGDLRTVFTPHAGWERWEYEHAFWLAVLRKDEALESEVDAAFRKSEFCASEEELAEWEAWQTYCRMRRGHQGAIGTLQSKVEKFPDNPLLNRYLGQALMRYKDYDRAMVAFQKTLSGATNLEQAARAIALITEAAAGSGKPINRALVVEKLREFPVDGSPADRAALAVAMRLIAQSEGLGVLVQSIDEIRLQIEPDDINLRFATAHQYGDDDADLAMIHYEAIPDVERSGMAWNNLGVSYTRLQVTAKSVSAFKVAAEKGETIADGNLAQKLITAGFLSEARELAERAVAVSGHHQNVVAALSTAAEAEDAENKTTDELRVKASKKQSFMKKLGEAALATEAFDIRGQWQTGECSLLITSREAGTFEGAGEYEEESRGLSGLGGLFGTKISKVVRVTVRLRQLGNAFEGTITKNSESGGSVTVLGILAAPQQERPLVLYFDDETRLLGRVHNYHYDDVTWTRLASMEPQAKVLSSQ